MVSQCLSNVYLMCNDMQYSLVLFFFSSSKKNLVIFAKNKMKRERENEQKKLQLKFKFLPQEKNQNLEKHVFFF